MNWVEQLTPEPRVKWNDRSREPFQLFKTVDEELAATTAFWRKRTPLERLEYLEPTRCVIYGEAVVNAKLIRCYGWRKRIEDEYDPKNIVYF